MADVKIPYADPGRAGFQELDTYLQGFLLAGNHPPLAPAFSFQLAASKTLAQFTVVGLDASGKLVAATYNATPASAIKPIGVLAHAATSGASDAVNGQVFYSGCFNVDALIWDATFDTEAKKLAAFQGSPTPTTIIVAKRGA